VLSRSSGAYYASVIFSVKYLFAIYFNGLAKRHGGVVVVLFASFDAVVAFFRLDRLSLLWEASQQCKCTRFFCESVSDYPDFSGVFSGGLW
tara:strand:+ start:2967 stop:3239 length:273 start_codon:yes stop_codon:yes gene_type:complete